MQEKQPYHFYIRILKPTLERFNIQLLEDEQSSIEILRKQRNNSDHSEFAPMVNNRILEAFKSDPQNDRAPVWLMRQAGRYLPEFMEISRDFSFFQRCENPFLASEITLHPTRRFPIDAAIIFADILTLPKAMGFDITMEPKQGPVIHNPLLQPSDIDRILITPNSKEIESVYDALYLTRLALEGKLSLIGFCGAPWTVFAYLVEGGSSKLFAKAKKWLYLWSEHTLRVMDILALASADYLIGCVRAGAQVVQIFDSWAGEIPTSDYIQYILPGLKKLATIFKQQYPNTPVIMFPRGACTVEVIQCFIKMTLEDQTSVVLFDGFNLDHSVSQDVLNILLQANRTVQGNMEPGVLYGEDDFIKQRCQQMVKTVQKSKKYIMNLAHGLTPEHKPEKVNVFVNEAIRASYEAFN